MDDQQPSSPQDLRERAVSSEPCSTRPNPFDESEFSARKRRRTSLSGASRSRSIDSLDSAGPSPQVGAQQQSTMEGSDLGSKPPRTPEPQTGKSDKPPSDSVPSKVTLSLRNSDRLSQTSSPLQSPCAPAASQPATQEDIVASVEDRDVDMLRLPSESATPAVSPREASTPPVVGIEEFEQDVECINIEPRRTILRKPIAVDPAREFPFEGATETYSELMIKLGQHYLTHDDVPTRVLGWLADYLAFVRMVDPAIALASYQQHKPLFAALPELVFCNSNRKLNTMRDPALCGRLTDLYKAFAQLTAHFADLDYRITQEVISSKTSRLPDLCSPFYMMVLGHVTRRDDEAFSTRPCDELSDVLEQFIQCHEGPGGTFTHLNKLVKSMIQLVPRNPRVLEHCGHIAQLAQSLVYESDRRLRFAGRTPAGNLHSVTLVTLQGRTFFETVSEALDNVIDKHLTSLSFECAATLISALGEIYMLLLAIHNGVMPIFPLEKVKEDAGGLSPASTPEVLASEWRMRLYGRLIISSQMQLRVMAVSQMTQELIQCWKKFSEPRSDENETILQHLAAALIDTGLVPYILGPTCHPEITLESNNIIGFLVVTRTYTQAHTDLMWQTVTSTQDPRISDALLRMMGRSANLFHHEDLLYFFTKLQALPIEVFGPSLREFCDAVFKYITVKTPPDAASESAPSQLCLRLLRESSTPSDTSPIAYPEIQQFATMKFRELLAALPDRDSREDLFVDCLKDIANKTETTLGSLHALFLMIRSSPARELQWLTAEHDLTRLLVDELEYSIIAGRKRGCFLAIHGTANAPRRELLYNVALHQPSTLMGEIGERLWHMLVGPGADYDEDRDTAWHLLNGLLKIGSRLENSYLSTCFREYLPKLPANCFREGMLQFVRMVVLPLANAADSDLLDVGDEDNESIGKQGMEQLWRIVLTAPNRTIEMKAIHTLVNDIYIDSAAVASSSHHRTRKIHLALVGRCLRQLSSAAKLLQSSKPLVSSETDLITRDDCSGDEAEQQSLLFIRSLAVLRDFHRLYRVKSNFAAPDLRSIPLQSPGNVEGESAELKFQSFDGNRHTDIQTLNIGKQNTAASLLASLKMATGFDHYQLYYRGQAFIPHERDICKSLEDLQIHNGLLLVKREPDAVSTAVRIRPGASPVEIEILGHFEELWGYLDMEEKYAQEVYQFLTTLPVYDQMSHVFQSSDVSHKDVFPLGYPFKSLYAVYALREFVAARRRVAGSLQVRADPDAAKLATKGYAEAINITLSLIVAVICDYEVVKQCTNEDLRVILSLALVENLLSLVKEHQHTGSLTNSLGGDLLTRLLSIEIAAVDSPPTENTLRLIQCTLQAICECCSASQAFWEAFRDDEELGQVIITLLLHDQRSIIRKTTSKTIGERIMYTQSSSTMTSMEFCEFLWPLISGVIPLAIEAPEKCDEIFALAYTMLKLLKEAGSAVLDEQNILEECGNLLLNHESYEDITQPDAIDVVAYSLVRMIHLLVCNRGEASTVGLMLSDDLAEVLFWKHLFPPWQQAQNLALPRVILNPHTRTMLIEIIFSLVGNDISQLRVLITNLDALVPFSIGEEEEDPYHYDLPQQFERSDAVRSACGYVGLKNLSNTCYLNSLLTQLFMNISFRRFMLNAEIEDDDGSQLLLFSTRNLFGSLQNSIKRWVDPHGCVAQIKTYEDTQIDIHNQMDVDEFYNLLFDRWESQFLSADAKKTLRSFYGGQLVQQVRSQECSHISERLEPFSAIQCDIKGKISLEESLQAYVDGEIMEGDNKYKCSTCDRHVDAVKRACLKDIPDNLIFHLKRFDFNLRTLQRHKINDYFSFPSRIDMRPYTINHLSSPSDDIPSDVFELVGVLVHSGTAESGHYYSYIRERPSTKKNETWVEFNDDVVSPWNTTHMEASCFGGTDYRTSLDGNMVMEKPYSAYMLFYQRSSSIKAEQDALLASRSSSPLRVHTPPDLAEHIRAENHSLLRRHCIFDPEQIRLISGSLAQLKVLNGGECSKDHKLEHLAIRMALSYLDQVISRTKDIPDFHTLLGHIQAATQACAKCSLALYDYFDQRHEALRALVQRHPEPRVRKESGNLFLRALIEIKQILPECYGITADGPSSEIHARNPRNVIHGASRIIQYLWEFFHMHLRSWHETFGLMVGFIGLGLHETAIFLDKGNLRHAILIISADSNMNLDIQYTRMLNALQRRLATKPPAYDSIIALIHRLLLALHIEYPQRNETVLTRYRSRFDEALAKGSGPLTMSRAELAVLGVDWGRDDGNIFLEKLITIDQNEASTQGIIVRLIQIHHQMGEKMLDTLRHNIKGDATPPPNGPFLRAALVFCRHYPAMDRVQWLVHYIAQQSSNLENTEGRAFYRFYRDLASTPTAPGEVTERCTQLELLVLQYMPVCAPSLLAYYEPSVRRDTEDLLHALIFQHGTSPSFEASEDGSAKAETLVKCAKQLGVECLRYIEHNFLARETRIAEEAVSSLQRVIHICSEYYDNDHGNKAATDFDALYQSTLESLARLIVDNDLEEESDQQWNDSEGSELDSIGSMNVDELSTYPKEFPEL